MISTITGYYGTQTDYPKIVRDVSSDEGENILADVIFEELIENKVFISEAQNAKKGLIKDADNYPNLTVKYQKYLK